MCSPQRSQTRQSEDLRPRVRASKISNEHLPPVEIVSQFVEAVISDESTDGPPAAGNPDRLEYGLILPGFRLATRFASLGRDDES